MSRSYEATYSQVCTSVQCGANLFDYLRLVQLKINKLFFTNLYKLCINNFTLSSDESQKFMNSHGIRIGWKSHSRLIEFIAYGCGPRGKYDFENKVESQEN